MSEITRRLRLTGHNLVGGRERAGSSETFTGVDPRNGESLLPSFAEATVAEVIEAVELAAEAFPTYADWSDERRASLLRHIADRLDEAEEEILPYADQETALGEARLVSELRRTTGQLRAFAWLLDDGWYVQAIIDPPDPAAQPTPRPDLRRVMVPMGPVGVFGAANFPLAFSVPGGDTASALAAGCPVVTKGHPSHPGTSELCARVIVAACEEVGAPKGVFSLVQGSSPEVGQALVTAPGLAAVGFTGSERAGRALADLAAQRPEPIPVYAEMGSLNPVFITAAAAQARSDDIAEGLVGSMTLSNGQFCTQPGLVFVPESEADRLCEAMGARLAERGAAPMLNEPIATSLRDRLAQTRALDDIETIVPGSADGNGGPACSPALLATDLDTFARQPALRKEHFGPVSVVIRSSEDRMEEAVGWLPGSLTATIHFEDSEIERVSALCRRLRETAGRVIANGYPTGVAVTAAMHHGGPYPATTMAQHTSVGALAIRRFQRGVCYQDMPQLLLPTALRDENPRGILRLVDGEWTAEPLGVASRSVVSGE